MSKHLVSRAAVLLWGLAILSSLLSTAWADVPKQVPARRLFAAGSNQILWLVVSEWDDKRDPEGSYTRRYLYQDAGSDRVHPFTVTPYPERIGALAVTGETLHVFRQDGSHVRFSKTRNSSAHRLPGDAVPIALAGEGSQNLLWAVVTAETAAQVDSEWTQRRIRERRERLQDTVPAQGNQEPVSSVPNAPADLKGFRIVRYDGAAWQPGTSMPDAFDGGGHTWLTVNNGRIDLFWSTESEPQQIHHAMYGEKKIWMPGTPISLPGPIYKGAVALINKQLVFAALVKKPDLSTAHCEQWSRPASASIADPWDKAAPLEDEKGSPIVLPVGESSGVSLFADRLALFRAGNGEPELATWIAGAGGKQEKPFEPVPAPTGREGPASPRSIRDLVSTLVVAAVLLLLFWRRQDASMNPLELPTGVHLAGYGRRAAAFLIDAAPAVAVMLWLWHDPLAGFYAEIRAAAEARQPMREAPAEVLWAWFWFRIIYVTYASIFEMVWSSTPGKRLLGCRVLSEHLYRPGPLQIGIRNISRMIELEPFLQIWPFMLIIFFTRNRQRLGDLLAHTLVVEPQPRREPEDEIPI